MYLEHNKIHTRLCIYYMYLSIYAHTSNMRKCTQMHVHIYTTLSNAQYLLVNHLSSSFTVRLLELVIACPVLIRKHPNLCIESIYSHLCKPNSHSSRHKASFGVFRPSLISFFHKESKPPFSGQTPWLVMTHIVSFSLNSQFCKFSESVQYAQRITNPHTNLTVVCIKTNRVPISVRSQSVHLFSECSNARAYIFTHICICWYVRIRQHVYMYKHVHMYIHTYMCTHIYTCTCLYIYTWGGYE